MLPRAANGAFDLHQDGGLLAMTGLVAWLRAAQPRERLILWNGHGKELKRASIFSGRFHRARAEIYSPERVVSKALSTVEWHRLIWSLHLADFWSLPAWHEQLGLDGETWTIEGRQGARFHTSACWCPPPSPYRDLGRAFLELAGIDGVETA